MRNPRGISLQDTPRFDDEMRCVFPTKLKSKALSGQRKKEPSENKTGVKWIPFWVFIFIHSGSQRGNSCKNWWQIYDRAFFECRNLKLRELLGK
jgi:hypothetical protein